MSREYTLQRAPHASTINIDYEAELLQVDASGLCGGTFQKPLCYARTAS
jgi:hypothetical protein